MSPVVDHDNICKSYRHLRVTPTIVHPSASEKDIRHAYKKLSKKYHPDRNKDPGTEDRFVEIAHGACVNALDSFTHS